MLNDSKSGSGLDEELRRNLQNIVDESVNRYRAWIEDRLPELYKAEEDKNKISVYLNQKHLTPSLRNMINKEIKQQEKTCAMHKSIIARYLDRIARKLNLQHGINFRDADYNSLTEQIDTYFRNAGMQGLLPDEKVQSSEAEVLDLPPSNVKAGEKQDSEYGANSTDTIDRKVNEHPFTKERTIYIKPTSNKNTGSSYHDRAMEVYKAWEKHMSNRKNSAYKNIDELRKDLGLGKNKFYEMVNYVKTNKQLENQNSEMPQLEDKIKAYRAYQNLQQEKREDSGLKYWRAAMREEQLAKEFGVSRSTFKKYARYIDKIKDMNSPVGEYVRQRI